MLDIADLVTAYGKIQALKGVSLHVESGRITCLLGPNGAGKTTLMMSIAAILKPRRGSIRLDSEELVGLSPAKIVAKGVALVPENRLVFPQMSVQENLYAGAYQRNDKAGVEADFERMYARFPRLKERREQLAGTLSGGEQQMLAVARALMSRPRMLLMDEPSLGLAPLIVAEIYSIISELNRDGTTIFLVEQNAHMALQVAHQFFLMEQGRITFKGTPGQIAEDEVIQRAYRRTSQRGLSRQRQRPMIDLVQNTVDGLMIGSSYGLLALGFTLIFGVMRRLNLSYGPSIMIGAYLGTLLHVQQGAGPVVVAGAVIAGAVLAGVYVERLCFAPMKAGAGVASMVSSFAIWMQLEQAAVLVLPRHTYPFPALSTAMPLEIGPISLRVDHLILLGCALILAAAVHVMLYRTRFGLGLRAIIGNPTAAHLVGVDVRRALLLAFVLASAIGGAAGFLVLAVDQQVTPMFGMWATLKGLIAMMIGGLGSIPGAVLGGLLLGVIEAHSQWFLGPQIRDLVAYLVLFAFLIVRPGGLLGQAQAVETTAPQEV